ncbi:uncharacterized protein [Drosophila bipectinata]|uniref:uncharacterized protein n=1 Tax=Drosophila bipectinata TaxID=42026 RepID=UPI0007E616F8|nr:uncharacterized protein LOC108124341 [Drosophila bipectinata]
MGKSSCFAIFLMALAIFSVCNANEDMETLKKGIQSLTNTMVKYQSEFDRKVQFKELQEAIDAIDRSMLGYMGTAKNRLDRVRSLNTQARISYSNCVKPVFEWCIMSNITLNLVIPNIGSEELTKHDRDSIFNITLNAIDMGLIHTENSLNLLNNVIQHTSDLRDLFKSIMHDVSDDFGVNGFYGKKRLEYMEKAESQKTTQLISNIFLSIGAVIFAPIGVSLGLAAAIGAATGTTDLNLWKGKTTYQDQVDLIDKFFQVLQDNINNATKIVENINGALEEDKTNLHALRGKISAANINKFLLTLESPALQRQFVPSLTNVVDQCIKYITWHGYNSSIYENVPGERRSLLFTALPTENLISNLNDRPQTRTVSELEQVQEPKQIKKLRSNSPQSSTILSNIHTIASYFKHVL